MSKFGWPRCLIESFLFWTVVGPAMSLIVHLITNRMDWSEWRYMWFVGGIDGTSSATILAGIALYTVMLAGILRYSRKNFLDK